MSDAFWMALGTFLALLLKELSDWYRARRLDAKANALAGTLDKLEVNTNSLSERLQQSALAQGTAEGLAEGRREGGRRINPPASDL